MAQRARRRELPNATDVRFGSTTDLIDPKSDFRSSPESGLKSGIAQCPKRVSCGHADYSITSSALASSVVGMLSPNPFAAFRFMTSSNFVGCSTGRVAGDAPFNILSM